jgi:hypothetical protein
LPSISWVCEIKAGSAERKNPTIGRSKNSKGKSSCRFLEGALCFGLCLKSIMSMANVAKRQIVKINPARRGRLYPRVVLEKTGFTKGIMLAAIVIINQFTGQRK